jgi:hypothetical protein
VPHREPPYSPNPAAGHPYQHTREQIEQSHRQISQGAAASKRATEPPATLGALLKFHHGLLATCLDCKHSAELDVLALSLRFGEICPVPDVVQYLRCTKPECGSKRCIVAITTSSIRRQ